MRRLPVLAHLPVEEVGRRYRDCADPREKTRWHALWLLLVDPGATVSMPISTLSVVLTASQDDNCIASMPKCRLSKA